MIDSHTPGLFEGGRGQKPETRHAMTQAAHEERSPMALPLPDGKLAMWLFLVTEIMFFTALIGTYLIIRSAIPSDPKDVIKWPEPHAVHLVEWMGAVNTFVLILSSLTVVLAHFFAGKGNFAQRRCVSASPLFWVWSFSESRPWNTTPRSSTTSCRAGSVNCCPTWA